MAYSYYCTHCGRELDQDHVLMDMYPIITGDADSRLRILKFRLTMQEFMALFNGGTDAGGGFRRCELSLAQLLGYVSNKNNLDDPAIATLTRQELCKIVTGLLDSAGVLGPYFPSQNVFSSISDEHKIADWAKDHVAFMMDNNLMAGDDQGRFRPTDSVTRQEAAIVAYRCFVRYGKELDGKIKTVLRSTKDANGKTIQTLVKTITLASGATVPLANYETMDDWEPVKPDGTPGFAPSGTPLQKPEENGLYRLKTYSETLASGEADEKLNRIFPNGKKFTSAEEANAKMSEVTVPVWKLDKNEKMYSSTLTFKIHSTLKEDVIAIFDEIYNAPVKAPLKDVNAYSWRNAMSSGTYSDHNYGVAIDLNYNENYCVYASGMVVGSFYDPQNSVYSFPADGTVVQTFAKYGWLWGGNAWVNGTVDYMHFSYLGK